MKFLITGADGLLGTKAVQILSQQHDVVGIDKEHDITKEETVSFIISQQPELILHAAAETGVDACELHPERAYAINVSGTENIIKAAQMLQAKLVYISSDFVFDGEKGGYTETDQPHPINVYGRTKWEAEKRVAACPNSLILRSAVLYGHNPNHYNFAQWVLAQLRQEKQMKVVTDQLNSPTLIDDLVQAIGMLQNKTGIYHVAGPEAISRYAFAKKVAEMFQYSPELVIPITSAGLQQAAPRPADASLNTSKIQSLGIRMAGPEAGLQIMKKQMEESA